MSDFDYKKYSLQKLEDWVCDAISTADATPQEVYDTIVSAITEYHDHHKKGLEYTTELHALLKGHRTQEWDAWEETYYPEEHKSSTEKGAFIGWNCNVKNEGKTYKVKKWVLPVEEVEDGDTGKQDYFVTFPDDLLEAANLKEGDQVEWVDRGDGSYLLKKLEKQMTHQEMLDAGYWMTDDGFWILKSDEC
jgi:hypothetical protein